MVRWFCPYCWNEVDERDAVCPHCGADLKGFSSLDYDQKLILALDCPITQSRMFVIELLGRRKTQDAVPKLCRMLFEDRNTFELVEIAKAPLNIGTADALECLQRRMKTEDNLILKRFLEGHL
jgi:Rubredoxin.